MTERILHCLAGALLLAVSSLAMAQYIWIDDKGVKQLSDRPPPPSVPDSRILKAPGKAPFNPNADFNKRKEDAAAAAKKAAAEAQQKADIAANCDAARKNLQALADGVRMTNYDSKGERGVMGDAERAEMTKKNQKVLAGCK